MKGFELITSAFDKALVAVKVQRLSRRRRGFNRNWSLEVVPRLSPALIRTDIFEHRFPTLRHRNERVDGAFCVFPRSRHFPPFPWYNQISLHTEHHGKTRYSSTAVVVESFSRLSHFDVSSLPFALKNLFSEEKSFGEITRKLLLFQFPLQFLYKTMMTSAPQHGSVVWSEINSVSWQMIRCFAIDSVEFFSHSTANKENAGELRWMKRWKLLPRR